MLYGCRFQDLAIEVEASPGIVAALQFRLHAFPPAGSNAIAKLRFEYQPVEKSTDHPVQRPAGHSRPVMELRHAQVLYFEESGTLYVEAGEQARVLCQAHLGRVQISYRTALEDQTWLLSHALFTIPLHELLKHHGYFMLHAAGLAEGGAGVLIAGESGAGKSTSALSLLRAGFAFLGDDTVFLRGRNGVWEACAFPEEMDLTEQTIKFFPELERLKSLQLQTGHTKHSVRARDLISHETAWQCLPKVLLFPQVKAVGKSELAEMTKQEALLRLMNSVLRTEPVMTQMHLDAVAGIVAQCQCYRLLAGRDFDALPALVRGVARPKANSR